MASTLTKDDLHGIMPPLTTPFSDDEELDLANFRREINYMLDLGARGFVVGGSTGEGYTLTPEELAEICAVAVREVRERVPVIAGIITRSTRDAVRRGTLVRKTGVNGIMVTPVIYQLPSDDGLLDYYETIWRVVGLPILIYNVLPHTPVSPRLLERIVQAVPGVVGVKESAGGNLDTLGQIIRSVGKKIAVTWATDGLMFPGYALGAVGSISGINTILPEQTIAMFDAIERNDLATARDLHYRVTPVADVVGVVNWPAGVKAAINLQGRPVGPARRPFVPIPAEQEARLRDALEAAGARVVATTRR